MNGGLTDTLRRLETQIAVARILATAKSLGEARPHLLETIGRALGWQLGALWELDEEGKHLLAREIWCDEPERCATFVQLSREHPMARGIGVPGMVWEEDRVVWCRDVLEASNFPRASAAAEAGLRAAIGIPIRVDGAVVGVVEFYAMAVAEPDDVAREWLEAIGGQIGQFVARKRGEAVLRESEERFRVFAESASDAIFTIDEESHILYANPAVERLFGYSADALAGRSLTVLIPERHREAHNNGIRRYLSTGRRNIPWTGVELPGLRADGTEIALEISFGEYMREGQRFFTGIARDMTERNRQKEELRTTARELKATVEALQARTKEAEEAARAKDDFLAVISHELRTPLNAILGYADLLLMGVPESVGDAASGQVTRIRTAAAHLAGLIEEVLTFSRTETGDERVNVKHVDPAEIAREAGTFVKPLARQKGLALHVDVADDLPEMQSDDVKLRQILVNLLTNGVKFTDRGEVELVVGHEGGMVVFTVRDTGRGIPREQLEHVFEPFWQGESAHTRSFGGTGIGLTVVHRLAAMLGGRVEIDSQVDVGTSVRVLIPRAAEVRAA